MSRGDRLDCRNIFSKTILIVTIAVAVTVVGSGLAQNVDPNKSRLRTAQELERRGNYNVALRIYRGLYDLVPRNQLYYDGVKRNMLHLKLYDELTQIINTQINLSGGRNPRFWADLGNVHYKRGDQARAQEIWQTILAQHISQKAAYIYVANAMIDNRLYDEAIEVYHNARKNFNENQLFVFELANIYVLRLKYREATIEYLNYLEKNPKQFSYIEGRIASYTKDSEQAQSVTDVLKTRISTSKRKYLLRKLLADLYLRVENFEMALQEFKRLETLKDPDQKRKGSLGKDLYFFAEKSLRAKQYQYARDAFELILANYGASPYRPRALYGIAISKQMEGHSAEALTNYRELIQTYPTTRWVEDASFQSAEIYFGQLFDLDLALATYHDLIRKFPNGKYTTRAHFRIGDCYAAKEIL
ncbi:MAG: tetratricopeptide repeat protein [bacterium]